jgi:predicted permease
MEATFADRLANADGARLRLSWVWARSVADVLAQATRERLSWRAAARVGRRQRWAADLRHAVRALRRAPGFTAAVLFSIALGVGAMSTVFAFTDAILIQPLPYPEADRLVAMSHTAPGVDVLEAEQSDGTYLHYRAHNRSFEEIATYYENVVNLSGADGEDAERVAVAMVSSTLFSVLGARPALGRLPSPDARVPSAPGNDPYGRGAVEGGVEVVISHDLWQRRYGGDPSIVGATIEANRARRTVIGVLEPGFAFPRPEVEIWYPEDPEPATARAVDMFKLGIGRLRPGVSAEDAERDLNQLIPSLAEAYPDFNMGELLERARLRAVVTPLKDDIVGRASRALWLLLGGMAFLLLAACTNVANLFLARAEQRRRDMAVRAALGGGRGDLARLGASESVFLIAAGGAIGLAATAVGVEALRGIIPPDSLPRMHEVVVDARVTTFGIVLSILLALVFSWVPAPRGTRGDLLSALKEGSSSVTGSRARQGARRMLVVGQVALALTLMVGASLMLRTFWSLSRLDPGFDAAGVLTAEIAMPFRGYERYETAYRLWSDLVERVSALPGVVSAGAVSGLPLVPKPDYFNLALDVEERPDEPYAGIATYHATSAYFAAMGIPVVEGTSVGPAGADVERPVLLSAAAARRLFPATTAVGKRIRRTAGPGPWLTVTGVVGDVPSNEVGGDAAEIVYLPLLDVPVDRGIPSQGALVVKASVAPESLAPSVRQIVRELDPNLPLANVRTMQTIVSESMSRTTLTLLLLALAAGAALFLGLVGVYGVTSYLVRRRTQEIGLRVALGARSAEIERLILREGAALIVGGLLIGLVASLGLGRLFRSLLYAIEPTDPASYGIAVLVLVGSGLAANWVPARRAARVDPVDALRCR